MTSPNPKISVQVHVAVLLEHRSTWAVANESKTSQTASNLQFNAQSCTSVACLTKLWFQTPGLASWLHTTCCSNAKKAFEHTMRIRGVKPALLARCRRGIRLNLPPTAYSRDRTVRSLNIRNTWEALNLPPTACSRDRTVRNLNTRNIWEVLNLPPTACSRDRTVRSLNVRNTWGVEPTADCLLTWQYQKYMGSVEPTADCLLMRQNRVSEENYSYIEILFMRLDELTNSFA